MAWNFNGTTGYLSVAQAAVAAAPLTLACWFRKTGTASSAKELVALSDSSANDQWFVLGAGDGSSARVYAAARAGSAASPAYATTAFGVNEWHHAAAVFVSNSERHAFLDGGSKGSSTGTATPTGTDCTAIGHTVLSGASAFLEGDIAEVAIWNTALTDAEIAVLARGFSPLCLWHRLPNLAVYQDLIRPLNRPGVGPAFTAVGGTSAAAHPRMIYPTGHPLGAFQQIVFAVPYRLAAAAAQAGRVALGWAALAGADHCTTCPIGEVSC